MNFSRRFDLPGGFSLERIRTVWKVGTRKVPVTAAGALEIREPRTGNPGADARVRAGADDDDDDDDTTTLGAAIGRLGSWYRWSRRREEIRPRTIRGAA